MRESFNYVQAVVLPAYSLQVPEYTNKPSVSKTLPFFEVKSVENKENNTTLEEKTFLALKCVCVCPLLCSAVCCLHRE